MKKTGEATGDFIGNETADKITSDSKKKSAKELHNNNNDEAKEGDAEMTTHEKSYISPEERKQIIDELRLVPKTYLSIKMHITRRKTINY